MKSYVLTIVLLLISGAAFAQDQLFKNKYMDFTYVTIAPVSYHEHAPNVGMENPLKPIPVGTTFDIAEDLGSYLRIECSDGVKGYVAKDEKSWAKLLTVYGRVVHKQWSKSLESWQAGGSDYCILDVSGEKKQELPGRFLRPSAEVPFAKIKKRNGQKVKICGIADSPKGGEIEPWSQYPVGPDGKPVCRPGSGKGIRIYAIWPMKETTNYMPEQQQQKQ